MMMDVRGFKECLEERCMIEIPQCKKDYRNEIILQSWSLSEEDFKEKSYSLIQWN